MTTIKTTLVLGLAAMLAPLSHAALVDFHFGAVTQTGAAAIGNAGDIWNTGNATNGGPVRLNDVTGQPTTISASWTSGDAWVATKNVVYTSAGPNAMDTATTGLMTSFLSSYAYNGGIATNLSLSLTGLAANQSYSLVLYGAGDQVNEGTQFTVTGSSAYTGNTSAVSRKLSKGAGVAYVTINVVSSATGTLKVVCAKGNYNWAVLNGFQLAPVDATTAGSTPTPVTPTLIATTAAAILAPTVTPAPSASTAVTAPTIAAIATVNAPALSTTTTTNAATTTKPTLTPLIWGINGHPSWSDYASWVPANVTTQVTALNQLGVKYYRIGWEASVNQSFMDLVAPKAQAAGITLLPIVPVTLVAANSAQVNYNNNYQLGYTQATYAISKGYAIPTWELGNEVEGGDLVSITYDGSSPNDFPDKTPGGFVAIASGFNGAYQGIKDAYTAGRASKLTTITPQVLIGMTYRHWGLMTKIQAYDNGVLPCDAISWHWYGPNYGGFNTVINDPKSAANGRTPVQCLNDFKSKTNPTQPMDIWITEVNRSQAVTGGLLNGSVANDAAPKSNQDWASEATAIQSNIDSFKPVPSIKAIFVYELYDEPLADFSSTELLASEGYFGLITGLNGTPKNAFYTYQTEIKAGR